MAPADQWRKADAEAVRHVLTTMREFDRVVPLSEFDTLVERFGWRTTPSASGKEIYRSKTSAFLNAPWDFGGHEVQVLFRPEGIRWISVLLTELIYPPTAESRLFTQDVFAECVPAARELLGEPSRMIAGETPEVRWTGSATTIALVSTGSRVSADLAPNAYYEDRDIAVEVDA